MDPEYGSIWFFVNTHQKPSTVEEALNNQVKSLTYPLHASPLPSPEIPMLPSDLMGKVGMEAEMQAPRGFSNLDFPSRRLPWLLLLWNNCPVIKTKLESLMWIRLECNKARNNVSRGRNAFSPDHRQHHLGSALECQNPAPACLVELDASSGLSGFGAPMGYQAGMYDKLKQQGRQRKVAWLD